MASAIKFGYDDYLKMFVFVNLAINDDSILARTSDVIQFNIYKAEEGSDYVHKKGKEFLMSKVFTYVGIESELEMKMFFLNTTIFQGQVEDINDEITLEGGSQIRNLDTPQSILYRAVAGY